MIEPIKDYVLIEPVVPEKDGTGLSSIENNKAVKIGIVIATGEDVATKLKTGSKVHYKASIYHIEVEDEGKKYLYVKISEIYGRVK